MKTYTNKSGIAGVRAYEILEDGIKIQFADGSIYLYNYKCNGKRSIETMKDLAKKGVGLTTFINQEIRGNYAEKIT